MHTGETVFADRNCRMYGRQVEVWSVGVIVLKQMFVHHIPFLLLKFSIVLCVFLEPDAVGIDNGKVFI